MKKGGKVKKKVNEDGCKKKDGEEMKGKKTRQLALLNRHFGPCYLH